MKLLKVLTGILMVMFLMGAVGCSDDDDDDKNPSSNQPTLFEEIVELGEAYFGAGTKNITGETLYQDMLAETGPELFIIDYRSADEFNAGHIEGAVHWAAGDMIDNLSQIPAGAKVINYCYSGQTASQVTSIMRLLGYDAWNLKWGICGWTADPNAGVQLKWLDRNPTEGLSDLLSTTATDLPATGAYPELTAESSDVMEAIKELADAYFESGTKNVSATNVMTAAGTHYDAEVFNYWPESLYSAAHIAGAYLWDTGYEADGVKPYKAFSMDMLAHLPKDEKIVFYCFTGQTSSQIAAYLNLLGYDCYSMLYGMNDVTADHTILNDIYYHAPGTNYPLVTE